MCAIERGDMQPFGARSVVVMFELVERRVVRAKGMTQEAVPGLGRRRGRVRPDVVGAFVVRDQYRAARDIRIVAMRQRNAARGQTDQQQERNADMPDLPLATEHQIQLTDWDCTASSIGRLEVW